MTPNPKNLSPRVRYVAGALAGALMATGLVALGATLTRPSPSTHDVTLTADTATTTPTDDPADPGKELSTTSTTDIATTTTEIGDAARITTVEKKVGEIDKRVTVVEGKVATTTTTPYQPPATTSTFAPIPPPSTVTSTSMMSDPGPPPLPSYNAASWKWRVTMVNGVVTATAENVSGADQYTPKGRVTWMSHPDSQVDRRTQGLNLLGDPATRPGGDPANRPPHAVTPAGATVRWTFTVPDDWPGAGQDWPVEVFGNQTTSGPNVEPD